MNLSNREYASAVQFPRVMLAAALLMVCAFTAQADDLKEGRAALTAGQLEQAVTLFEKAAQQGSAEGRAGVGLVWLKRHDDAKARDAFETATKMDGNLAQPYFGLGEIERHAGKYAEAVEHYKRASDLDRRYPEALLAYSDALVQLKRYDEAIQVLQPGLNWGARTKPRFLVALGNVEMGRDSLRDAGIYFTQAQQEAPDDPQTNRALGDFYLKRGIGSLAVPNYQKAVALDSMDVELHYALGRALYFDKQYNEALEQYRWVTMRDPDYALGQFALGNLYYLSGQADTRRYTDAQPYLERYVKLMPDDAKGWSVLGRDYYFLKMKDEAVTAMSKAAALGEKSKDMYTILGRAYADRKEWQNALDAYAKGDPNTTDLLKMGQMHVFLGNIDRADSVYQAMIDRDSTSSDAKFALLERGKLKFRQKDYPGAVSVMARRIALDPNSDEAYYYTGLSYKEMKQFPEAIAALRQAAVLAPGKSDRHFWLGLVLAQADSIPDALNSLSRSTELDSTSRNAAIAFQQIGYRALLAKNWEGATRPLERSVAIYDKDVQTLIWLAQGYQNSGNKAKAIETYRKVLQLQPGHPEATKGLKSLAGQ